MFFWNRVELYNGFSLKEFSDLRDSLIAKGIGYEYKLNNRNRNRAKISSFGENPEFQTQYYLYVHHKDYEQAMFLTSNRQSKLY
jgi:hypothetical protein